MSDTSWSCAIVVLDEDDDDDDCRGEVFGRAAPAAAGPSVAEPPGATTEDDANDDDADDNDEDDDDEEARTSTFVVEGINSAAYFAWDGVVDMRSQAVSPFPVRAFTYASLAARSVSALRIFTAASPIPLAAAA